MVERRAHIRYFVLRTSVCTRDSTISGARKFTELQFWQRARQWSKSIFQITKQAPFSRDQRLVVQINDSSESVMSNMAEGYGRSTQEEFITFLGYALGSLDETLSHLCAAYDREYLTKEQFADLFREGNGDSQDDCGFHPVDGRPAGRCENNDEAEVLVRASQ